MRIGAILAAVLGLSMAAGTVWAEAGDKRTITINGMGVVEKAPDQAVITIGARHQAEMAEDAMAQVNQVMARILDRLDASGVAPSEIQTGSLSLRPIYQQDRESRENILVGYAAENILNVEVTTMQSVGDILGDLVEVGANDIRGIRFELDAPRAAQDEARALAVEDARARAEVLATAAGVELGQVLQISEHGGGRPEMMRMSAAPAMADQVAIMPGELSITSNVTIVWEIAEAEQ